MALFERGGLPKALNDNHGDVRITMRLIATENTEVQKKGQPVRGNISRNLTIKNAKLSEVAEAITEFLFGGDDE